jgi:hypothetical protein
MYQIRVITVFTVFRLLTDFVCLYNYEFWLSLCKIVRSSVILLLPLFELEVCCIFLRYYFLTIDWHLTTSRLVLSRGLYFQSTNKRWTLVFKTEYTPRNTVRLVDLFNSLHLIGRSKTNESLPDMTTKGMFYMLVYHQKKKPKRYNKHLILFKFITVLLSVGSLYNGGHDNQMATFYYYK